mmetsp:Transcript_19823/g.14581  ORF Transcript_19823/g.14581 Transcript_19823/m.14581 type:complete len:87 (+) Transcript_19823:174-434(+)
MERAYVEENGRRARKEVKRSNKKTLIDVKQKCLEIEEGRLKSNDYSIPFSFKLPPVLPQSIYFKDNNHPAKPKAKVKYFIRGTLLY